MDVACDAESRNAAFVAKPAPHLPPLACALGDIRKLACASADLGTGATYLSEPLEAEHTGCEQGCALST